MRKANIKPRIKKNELNPVFHFKERESDDKVLTKEKIKEALKTGKLEIQNKNLIAVPEQVYNIQNQKEVKINPNVFDLSRTENDEWWNQCNLKHLDLSSNLLREISSDIKNLLSLTVINLNDNELTALPKEIGLLENLTKINLSRNKIVELPEEFFRLRELKVLNISYNCLIEISSNLADLINLEILDLSNNQLESLPVGIGFLTRLNFLSVHHNKLSVLPCDITNLRSLMKFDIMNNQLKFLPDHMGDLRKLEFLYAQHNDIDKIPNFDGCKHLQELHISNNFIKEISEDIFEKLPSLKVLDLRDNKIEKLPDEISMLQSLMRLDISNNSITSLPTSLCTLANLVSLQVEGNPIKSIRRDVIACGTQRILRTLRDRAKSGEEEDRKKNVQAIKFSNESAFPDKYQLKKSKSLTLCGIKLCEIPEQVFIDAADAEIQIVDLSKNKLKKLPEGLLHLSHKISELNFNGNQLNEIQPFISQFTHIIYLNLSSNFLEELPDEIGLLATLREINIANNRIKKSFPKCIYKLVHLEILIACDNKIEEIDVSEHGLMALKRLATLDLSNNNLNYIPPILGNMTQLLNLSLHGNCFKSPRTQILEKGTASVLSYLRDRIPREF